MIKNKFQGARIAQKVKDYTPTFAQRDNAHAALKRKGFSIILVFITTSSLMFLAACTGLIKPAVTPTPITKDTAVAYTIDFTADPPTINRLSDQYAQITGNVLHAADLTPAGLPYTMTIELSGGPINSDLIPLPPQAGRGMTTFSDRTQPRLTTDGASDTLAISLLGMLGTDVEPPQGRGLTFYRDPSSAALVSLTLGERYNLANVRYTLTDIDMLLGGADCDAAGPPAEPNNVACGGSFIDQVTILSSGGRNAYTPADPDQIALVGDVITARFDDADNSGRPDAMSDRRVLADSDQGNVAVFHPTDIGPTLQFRFSDASEGLDGDPDGYHDFDAAQQAIGLASGITFNVIELPTAPLPTPDPNLTTIEGLVFSDANQDGLQDADEAGLPGLTIDLYAWEDVRQRKIITTTTGIQSDNLGRYRLDNVHANTTYQVEALLPLPQVTGGGELNPLRLIQIITPTVAGPNIVDFGAWPFLLEEPGLEGYDIAALTAAGLLLPDLQPLTGYPLPDDLSDAVRADIERSYPGLEDWYLDTESQPGRVLLRFGTLALNRGTGPLHVLGGLDQGDSRPVYQRIYTRSGAFIERLAGEFETHEGHNHVHLAAFEQYTLRDTETNAVVASGPKVSFCLTDVLWSIEPELTLAAPVGIVPRGWNCGEYEQSINVGYSDYYGPALPDQWIDITDVPDGTYWIEVMVNPEWQLLESDVTNNLIRIQADIDNPLQ